MRKALAIGGAVVLALVGTLLLMNYVQGAEERATEGLELAQVLVVEDLIEEGTLASEVLPSLRTEEIPVSALAQGAVSDLADLSGLVAAVDLVPGEQLIASRFKTPEALAAETRIEVPADLLQATFSLDPDRAVGGRLLAGDHVAFLASFDPFQLGAVEPGDLEGLEEAQGSVIVVTGENGESTTPLQLETPNSTKIVIHKVLVTGVQVEEAPQESEDGQTFDLAPTGNLLITLAAPAEDIEKMVFTAEHGRIWLALEDEDAPEPETEIRTRGNIYR